MGFVQSAGQACSNQLRLDEIEEESHTISEMGCAKGRTPSRDRGRTSSMAPPPDLIDDAVAEILLRLPPADPACLVRASLVCKPWRRVLSDPAFPARYRAFHRTPPLLGFLRSFEDSDLLVPITTRIPIPFLKPPFRCRPLDCRHGRVLLDMSMRESLAVWDTITGDHTVLPKLDCRMPYFRSGVVLCAAAGCDHHDCQDGPFLVVFVGNDDMVARACVYSSETAAWSEPASVQLGGRSGRSYVENKRGVIVGDEFFFSLNVCTTLLKFDLGKHCLSVISLPFVDVDSFVLMSMEDGLSMGLAGIKGSKLHLWSRKLDSEGDAIWARYGAIVLEKLLHSDKPYHRADVIGFAEGVGALLVVADSSAFMFELKSRMVRKVISNHGYCYEVFPFTSFYIPDFAGSKLQFLADTS